MDINNIQELKAYAYDLISRTEAWQRELQAVNQQIAKLTTPENKEEVKEEVKQTPKE